MIKETGFKLYIAEFIFLAKNYYYLGVLLFLFSCNSASTNGNTAENQEEIGTTASIEGNTAAIELGDISEIEAYFLKLSKDVVGLSIEKRKELLQAHKSGKGSISIDEGIKAKLTKLDVSNGYLSFSTDYETGEGGGFYTNSELATFKNGGGSTLAFSSVEAGSGHAPSTSTINFFKVDGDQLNKTKINFPAFKLKDFYVVEKEGINCSNGEDKFNDFSCDLSKSNSNTILLKANFNDAISCSANKGVELKLTANGLEGASSSDTKLSCVEDPNNTEEFSKRYCSYHQYRTVLVTEEDEKGRSDSYSSLEKKVGAEYKRIKVSELFVADAKALLERINKEVRQAKDALKKDYADDPDCLDEMEGNTNYTLADVSVSFYEEGIFFGFDFGFSSACFALGGNGFILKWEEAKPFIKL